MDGFNSRLITAEKRMSELEDKSKYNTQTAVQRDKGIENIEYQGRDIWAIVKTSNICITKIVKRR